MNKTVGLVEKDDYSLAKWDVEGIYVNRSYWFFVTYGLGESLYLPIWSRVESRSGGNGEAEHLLTISFWVIAAIRGYISLP